MDNLVAVAAGYNFALVPATDLSGVNLKQIGTVRYEGKTSTLFKGATYEDSRMIDVLLDRFGDRPFKDFLIHPVIMRGEVEMTIPGFDKERDNFFFGAYAVVCDGKVIPFDFSGIAWDIDVEGDRVLVSFETGRTPLLTDCYLDDCYEKEYEEAGLRINDVTAEFLARATAISEFMVCLELNGEELHPEDISQRGSFCINSLSFSDHEKDYPVAPDILTAFQQKLSARNVSIDQRICSAETKATATRDLDVPKNTLER